MSAQRANNTKDKVRQLQRKLYRAAKDNSKRRFHALYDKMYREDILTEAWKRVKANDGAAGIDGVSIKDVEAYGVQRMLGELRQALMKGEYRPLSSRRVYIEKSDGSMRPLSIPAVKDRIVQMAAKLVIEPVFEADFKECSFGFRPRRSARDALEVVRKACNRRGWCVVDADIEAFFDSINHDKLMKLVEMRISDRRATKLLRQWLTVGIMAEGSKSPSEIGSPQGSPISPLLSNIYLNYLDALWKRNGSHLGTLVRYADDFVVIARTRKDAEHALRLVRAILGRLDLTLHPQKTRLVRMWDGKEGFDFLGFHHRRLVAENAKGQRYSHTHQYPSKRAMKKMRQDVKAVLAKRSALPLDIQTLIDKLNPMIRGWRNYYGVKTAVRWLNKIDWYILLRFTLWWNKKRRRRSHLSNLRGVRALIYANGLLKLAVI